MAWLNSNADCGLLFPLIYCIWLVLDNRPLLSITHLCHENQSVAMDTVLFTLEDKFL